jgi:hypothetical protein
MWVMPRRKAKQSEVEQKPSSAVPAYVQDSKILQKRKVTKRTLPSFTEAMMLLHAPEAQRLAWAALLNGADAGNKEAVRTILEIFGLVQKSGGFTLNQQILQQNAAAGVESPVKGFDAFTRELAEARAGHALPPPSEVIVEVRPADSAPAGD